MKLHMLINTNGKIVRLHITSGNVSDKAPVLDILKDIKTRLIADKGYLSQPLFDQLFVQGVTLITKIEKRMKDSLHIMANKFMLMQRHFLKIVFSSIKSLQTLIHYLLRTDKPTIK